MSGLRRWGREILMTSLLVVTVIIAVDWWRMPQLPGGFTDISLQTLDGQTLPVSVLSADKPLLIYFWASWCGVCRYTTPPVEKLYRQGGNVLTVAYRSGNQQQVTQWLNQRNYHLPVINDAAGSLAQKWQISATPVFVFIYQGRVITATTGWTSTWGVRLRLWLAGILPLG